MKALLVVAFILFALFVGRILATGSDLAIMLTVVIVSMIVLSFRPTVGFFVCYALLIVVPVTDLRMDVPVFHSPLQAVAFLTVGAALLRFPSSGRTIPRSRIYLPLVVVVALHLMFALVGHGDEPGTRLYDFVAGMWPLILILLLVDTPRRARAVLVGVAAACISLTIMWLPGLLALARFSKSDELADQIRRGHMYTGFQDNPGAVSLLGTVGSISVQTLVALALVGIILLGVALGSRGWRAPAFFGFLTITLTVFTATFASAVAALAVGIVATFVFFALPNLRPMDNKLRIILNASLAIVIVLAIGLSTKPGQTALDRLTHPKKDVSGQVRLDSLSSGWHAFIESPWIGQGVAVQYRITSTGWQLAGHNTYGVMAYEYGLIMLVPFAWLLVTVGRELWKLRRSALTPSDVGVASGILGCFAAAVVTGLMTPVFGQVFEDTIIWTAVGLAIVWNNWRDADPEAVLMA